MKFLFVFVFVFVFKDTLDTLLLTEQFLVNRTGSWMKTVEWLCHLTAMSVEFLQAGIFRGSNCQALNQIVMALNQ